MEDGKGQRLHIRMSHHSCQWKLKWEPTSLVAGGLRHRMSTRAAVWWMCLRVAQFPKCESRSVKSCPPVFYGLFLWRWGAREHLNSFPKILPKAPHLVVISEVMLFIIDPQGLVQCLVRNKSSTYIYLPKGGSTPSSLAPSSPWVTMLCYSSNDLSFCMALPCSWLLSWSRPPCLYGLHDCIWLVLSLLICLLDHYSQKDKQIFLKDLQLLRLC